MYDGYFGRHIQIPKLPERAVGIVLSGTGNDSGEHRNGQHLVPQIITIMDAMRLKFRFLPPVGARILVFACWAMHRRTSGWSARDPTASQRMRSRFACPFCAKST